MDFCQYLCPCLPSCLWRCLWVHRCPGLSCHYSGWWPLKQTGRPIWEGPCSSRRWLFTNALTGLVCDLLYWGYYLGRYECQGGDALATLSIPNLSLTLHSLTWELISKPAPVIPPEPQELSNNPHRLLLCRMWFLFFVQSCREEKNSGIGSCMAFPDRNYNLPSEVEQEIMTLVSNTYSGTEKVSRLSNLSCNMLHLSLDVSRKSLPGFPCTEVCRCLCPWYPTL